MQNEVTFQQCAYRRKNEDIKFGMQEKVWLNETNTHLETKNFNVYSTYSTPS